ncbi:MAG: hypothetical protein Q9212_001130 [Teloschistes hypoglaucus]
MLTVSSNSVANGSTGNLGDDPFTGFILRTDRQGGPNQFSDDFLGLVAITALKEEALLDFDEPVLDFDFMDDMHPENPVHIAMTAEVRSGAHGKTRRGTVMWAVYAVVVDMLRTRYLRPLVFSVFYYAEHLYTGSITLRDPRPASNTISNQSLNEIPVDSTHILLKASASSRDQVQYKLYFDFVPPAPLPRPVLGEFSMFETLMAFVLQLGPRSSGSITPRTGTALGRLYAWVFMKEAVPPLQGYAFQQYQAVAIAEAIARYCVFHSRSDEVVFKFLEPVELSEYERQRQENIAQRDKLLKQLALDASSAGLGPGQKPKPARSANAHRKKPAVKKIKEEIVPRRTSSRIAGIEADSEVAKRKAEEEYVAVQEAARVKRQRVSGPLDLSEVQVAGKGWDKNENFLVDVVSRGANPYERTFGDEEIKETTDKELRALREKMSGLELYDGFEPNRIKITPERIYSLGFHPVAEKPLVFAGDKLGNLGLFDASQSSSSVKKEAIKSEEQDEEDEEEDDPDPNITSFHLHTRTISSFQFSPYNPSHLYTSSYDSSLRLLDLTASSSSEIYAPTDTSLDEPISGVEMDPHSPHLLYFSRLDGHVGRVDTRASPDTVEVFELSEKKIGGFSLNPSVPHFIATASLDRTMRIWDLRKLSGKRGGPQLPALCGEHESRLSVSHAAFNAAGQVATASYDDTVKIHTFEGMSGWEAGRELGEQEMKPSSVVRHNNQTGRWVTILRAQWQLRPQDNVHRFCIGNMNRFVDIYTSKGEQLAQLGGDGITAVPAVAQFHPTNDWVAAGTASGKLCLWM